MLSGHFVNCYGIKEFNMPQINFNRCNKAIIYAPNGVMKTSLSRVFEDLSKGSATTDRIFKDAVSSYSVKYYDNEFIYTSSNTEHIRQSDSIYVVNSFADKFEFNKDNVGTLLADERTRNEYNTLMAQLGGEITQIENSLRSVTGLTKPKIKGALISDLELETIADWTDIFETLNNLMPTYNVSDMFSEIKYIDLFNDKAIAACQKPEFKRYISQYIEKLDELLEHSPLVNRSFTDRSAEALSKAFNSNNLFNARHKLVLRDGTEIKTIQEWEELVHNQLQSIYQEPELNKAFEKLKKSLTANNETNRLRDIIIAYREIIPMLSDISKLKKQIWLNCFNRLDKTFDMYYDVISTYTDQIRSLYEKASQQSEHWKSVVEEFNRRFRVPFTVKINNKANFLLKDEAPNVSFVYSRGDGENQQLAQMSKDDLMLTLSMGEKRALYLLYILFDLERIKLLAEEGNGKYLIIADDIADSFDYKNKYAIIEYLADLSKSNGIDLLTLTHNFDFYRTMKFRLGIVRNNCFIAQKNENAIVSMTVFKYQKDFFKNVIINNIEDGKIDTIDRKKYLIASIPFYRNLTEYSGKDDDYTALTCFLHYKTEPLNTEVLKLEDLWELIKQYLNDVTYDGPNEKYYTVINNIATEVLSVDTDEVSLENKLVLSMATRLVAEKFMKQVIEDNLGSCADSSSNQTREWFEKAKPYLSREEIRVIDEINLITPESIHLNSFMYEPLIDISDWSLKELYMQARQLELNRNQI